MPPLKVGRRDQHIVVAVTVHVTGPAHFSSKLGARVIRLRSMTRQRRRDEQRTAEQNRTCGADKDTRGNKNEAAMVHVLSLGVGIETILLRRIIKRRLWIRCDGLIGFLHPVYAPE